MPPEDEIDIEDLPPEQRTRARKIQALKDEAELIRKETGAFGTATLYGSEDAKAEKKAIKKAGEEKLKDIEAQLNDLGASLNESLFHEREKLMLEHETRLISEGKGDAKSQWAISRTAMDNMSGIINMRNYGAWIVTGKQRLV